MPLFSLGFFVSLFSTARAALAQFRPGTRRTLVWDKTVRFRRPYRKRVFYPLPSDAAPAGASAAGRLSQSGFLRGVLRFRLPFRSAA